MAAAYLTMAFSGQNVGVKAIAGYASDATNVLIKFDEVKIPVAGSNDHYQAPGPGAIVDIVFTSDLATPTHIQVLRNGKATGDILDVTAHLASVVSRPRMAIPFNSGDKIQIMQIA